MEQNIFGIWAGRIRDILVYKRKESSRFVMEEEIPEGQETGTGEEAALQPLVKALELSRQTAALGEQLRAALTLPEAASSLSAIKSSLAEIEREFYGSGLVPQTLRYSLDDNINILKQLFQGDLNKDLVVRRFWLPDGETEAAIAAMEGIADKKLIDAFILKPLMSMAKEQAAGLQGKAMEILADGIPGNQAKITREFDSAVAGILGGDTALFIDKMEEALVIDTRGAESRSLSRPQIEPSVRGSQVAFSEGLRINTALVRSMMRSRDLVTEIVMIGQQTKTPCAIMYIRNIANRSLVKEVKRRLARITLDYIPGSGALEQLICDHPNLPLPQTLSTERPDRVVPHLAEGRVAVFIDGDPFVIVVPFQFFGLFHTADDFNLQTTLAIFSRVFRLIGTVLAAILPAIYLAISYYHQEAIPTELLLAIAGERERVPFPSFVEILLMEFSFELIREAGTRIPGMLGSTIGIVGAIIIGQAAVSANLVSPIMVVIVAVTGLASFTIPDYRASLAIRLARFVYLFLATIMGLVGIAGGIIVSIAVMCYMKSFGVPYLSPVAPKTKPGFDTVVRGPIEKQKRLPDELNTQKVKR